MLFSFCLHFKDLKQNQTLRKEGTSFTPFATYEESGEQKFACNISENENVKMVCNSFLFKALHKALDLREF